MWTAVDLSRGGQRLARAALLLALLFACLFPPRTTLAQEATSHTVAAGDTLSAIAARYGVSTETLVAANGITDPSLIRVGQVLTIPRGGDSGTDSTPTTAVYAQPGETLALLARRLGQETALLAQLNGLSETERLFPGRPIAVPVEAVPPQPLRFGAVSEVEAPLTLTQGQTGLLAIGTRRPLALAAIWNGLPLPLGLLGDDPLRQFAFLPVPALLAPGSYPLTVAYSSSGGTVVSRTWMIQIADGGYDSQAIVVADEKSTLLDPALVEAELEQLTTSWSQVSPNSLWQGTFARPIDPQHATTSPFGTRRSYNGETTFSSYHAGQDFGAPEGIPVLAPAPGIVVLAEPLQVRGGAVLLDHGRGVFTGYWHLSELTVAPGQTVDTGDVLGLVGNTGLSTGAHLHWELRIYGVAVDPMPFLGGAPILAKTASSP